jgi:hypothetical protein
VSDRDQSVIAALSQAYPSAAPEPGTPAEAEGWIADALASDDSYRTVKLVDAALAILGPRADALLIRAVAFNALGQQMWWLFDLKQAIALRDAGSKSQFPDAIWERERGRVAALEQTLGPTVIADYQNKRDANLLYNRGYRALQRSDGKTALHFFARSLAIRVMPLTLWYGCIALLDDGRHEHALWCLERLPGTEATERAHLFSLVSEANIAAVRECLDGVVNRGGDAAALRPLVLRAMGR